MTPAFPTAVRDELFLNADFVHDLGLDTQQTETNLPAIPLLFVARVLHLAGATIRGHDVVIVADEVDEAGTSNGVPGLTLITNKPVAAQEVTGRAGHTLTIWTRKLGVASAVSIGQKGGAGRKGTKPADFENCDPPPPVDPLTGRNTPAAGPDGPIDPDPGPVSEQGTQGGQGGDGAKGGQGGRIVVHTVAPPALGASAAARFRGIGGAAGFKGPGGDGGFGCPKGTNQGEQGPNGGTLGPGDDLAGTVDTITDAAFEAAVRDQILGFTWAFPRLMAADAAARRGRPATAKAEVDRALQLDGTVQGLPLRSRLRNGLTPFGVERDLNVSPSIPGHVAEWTAAVATYNQRVLRDGSPVFHFLSRERLLDEYDRLATDHQDMIENDLAAVGTQRLQRFTEIGFQRTALAGKLDEVQARIAGLLTDAELPPAIVVAPNVTLPADQLATLIRAHLADEKGQAPDSRHLLAADLDLLAAHAENDTVAGPATATELAPIRLRAIGLAGAAGAVPPWGAADAVIGFSRVRREVRSTTGHPRLLLELTELVELAHRSRMLQLREIQLAEGDLVFESRVAEMKVNQFNLEQPAENTSTEQLALNWLDAVGDFADVFAWRTQGGERAVTLYTLDATPVGFEHPGAGSPSTANAAVLFGPDRREDLRQHAGFPDAELSVGVINATENNPDVAEDTYKRRATFVEGAGNSPVDPLEFSSVGRPEVMLRLKDTGEVWFDATLDDLQAGRAEGKVVGVGAVFTGLTTSSDNGTNPPDSLSVFVEHSGISVQRRMDDVVVPQYLYPGEVRVVLQRKPPGPAGLSSNWTGEMRFDDLQDDGTPGTADKFPLWGRGAAAGWRFRFANSGPLNLAEDATFQFQVEYDSFAVPGVSSLLRIDAPLSALVPGQTVHATAVLTEPAPAGGLKIALTSQHPEILSMPAAVLVPAGADRASIPVKVLAASSKLVELTAKSPDGFGRRAQVTVQAPVTGQAAPVSRLDIRAPGEEFAGVSGLAFDGDRLLATAGKVRIDPDGTIRPDGPGNLLSVKTGRGGMSGLQRFPIVKQPRAIDVANGKAYVVNNDPSVYSLGIIDLATNKPLAETHIGFGPTQVAVDPAANLVYVSNWGGKSVEVFHGTTGERVASIPGLRGPNGLAVDTARRRVYVALNYFSDGPDNTENGLAVIQRARTGTGHTLDRIIPIPGRTLPMDVAYDSTRGLIHVVNIGVAGEQLPGMTTFRASDLAKLGFTPVPGPLFCCDVHLASGAVVCGGPAAAVHVVDGVNRRMVSSQAVAHAVASVAFHQPTGTIFVGDRQKGEIIRLAPVSVEQTAWR